MPRPKREIPWLDKRGGTYYVFWYNSATKKSEKSSLRTTDAAEAQDRYAAFLTEGKAIFAEGPLGLTVPAALDNYYFEHAKQNSVAIATIEVNIEHLKEHFPDTLIKDIDVPTCRAYVETRVRQGVKPTTAGKELATLKAAAYHAVKWKRLTTAQMPVFEIPHGEASKGVWLFPDELEQLRQGAMQLKDEPFPLRTLSFIDLCYFTASRREAIESLTWPQVDLARRRIVLAKPGEKKTNKRRPTIAIDPKAMPTLLRLKDQRTTLYVLGSDRRMYSWFKSAARAAGLETLPEREMRPQAEITPHMLRHSRATHLLQAGKSPWAVANLLGDTLATVERVYGHHTPMHTETLFDEPVAMDELLG